MKRLKVCKGCRIDKIYAMTDDWFNGEYKGHIIEINRESDDDFYIYVKNFDGGISYDGWWRHKGKDSIRDAIEEALKGSCLLAPCVKNAETLENEDV